MAAVPKSYKVNTLQAANLSFAKNLASSGISTPTNGTGLASEVPHADQNERETFKHRLLEQERRFRSQEVPIGTSNTVACKYWFRFESPPNTRYLIAIIFRSQ